VAYYEFHWTDEVVEHLEEQGVSQDDFEYVFSKPTSKGYSRSSGLPAVWVYTEDGRYILAVFEELDDVTILPVTAYEVPEPQ
jgi:hypothetical protein